MSRLFCWLRSVKYTFVDNPIGLFYFGAITSGHMYCERYSCAEFSVLECDECGGISVGYYDL